jgi:hypothetical protein
MNPESLTENWALWAALVPATMAVAVVAWLVYRRSAGGQLRAALKAHRSAERDLDKASRSVRGMQGRLQRLMKKAGKVKPRLLQEARDELEDAQALERIMKDKAQVTRNLVRRAIFEEFPPAKHERLRAKHLPEDVESGRPFTF